MCLPQRFGWNGGQKLRPLSLVSEQLFTLVYMACWRAWGSLVLELWFGENFSELDS